jgi:hypothetical protein
MVPKPSHLAGKSRNEVQFGHECSNVPTEASPSGPCEANVWDMLTATPPTPASGAIQAHSSGSSWGKIERWPQIR